MILSPTMRLAQLIMSAVSRTAIRRMRRYVRALRDVAGGFVGVVVLSNLTPVLPAVHGGDSEGCP